MYPDTDLPPIAVAESRLARIRHELPEPTWDRADRYARDGLPGDVIDKLMHTPLARMFDGVVAGSGVSPMTAAHFVCRFGAHLAREGLGLDALHDEVLVELFRRHVGGEVAREGLPVALRLLARRAREDTFSSAANEVARTLADLNIHPLDDTAIEERVGEAVDEFDFTSLHDPDAAPRYLMGVLMRELRGCADGKRVLMVLEAALRARVPG
jgi:Glu-tRNA(Gln) amidotransferase subunit E-like FAD-binding protein